VKINEVGYCKCLAWSRRSDIGNDWVVLGKMLEIWEFSGQWSSLKEGVVSETTGWCSEGALLACLVVYFRRS